MSAASCGSFCSLRLRPRAAKCSRQRIPHRSSCNPVSTVSRPQPKRRSAWRALPPQSSVATSARNNRRWYPVRRLAPDRIKASRRSTESSMGMAQPDDETVIAQLGVSHHWTGQDSPVRGRFPLTGRLKPHNWAVRQPQSDRVADRVSRERQMTYAMPDRPEVTLRGDGPPVAAYVPELEREEETDIPPDPP